MNDTSDGGHAAPHGGEAYAPPGSVMAEEFRREYELQILRRSCPSCGEAAMGPAAICSAADVDRDASS